jgi:hydrogenase expression/formation protein HypE
VSEAATVIGAVGKAPTGRVTCRSPIGGRRVLDMLAGDQLPRIC